MVLMHTILFKEKASQNIFISFLSNIWNQWPITIMGLVHQSRALHKLGAKVNKKLHLHHSIGWIEYGFNVFLHCKSGVSISKWLPKDYKDQFSLLHSNMDALNIEFAFGVAINIINEKGPWLVVISLTLKIKTLERFPHLYKWNYNPVNLRQWQDKT